MFRHTTWRLPCAVIVALFAAPGPAAADSMPSLRVGPLPESRAAERPPAFSAAVETARASIGSPYAMGSSGPGAFDCSGLMIHAFSSAGVTLPHSSFAQFGMGRAVERDAIRAGDLVFFSTAGPGASHVGVATAKGTVVSATSHGVMEHSMSDAYWGGSYVGARRLSR